MDKTIKIKKYSKHPEMEGDKLEVTIINNEKIKPRMRSKIAPKPKPSRMTIEQLAVIVNNLAGEMRAGFARINTEIAAVNQRIDKIEDILIRNNLK